MKPRKAIKKIHLWLTLIFFIPLVIQGLTGTILVFEHEIEGLISGGHKEYKLSQTKNQNLQETGKIIAAAKNSVPTNYSPTFIIFPENEPATINFMDGKKPRISAIVDPYTLEVLGIEEVKPNAILRTIHQLHTNLLIPGQTGRNLVGYVGLIMLLMLISGIIIWFPKQMSRLREGFFFRFSDVGYNFHKALHKSVGIWSYIVFFIVTFSGVYIVFPQYIEPLIIESRMREKITLPKVKADIINVDTAVKIARDTFPDEKITSISIATAPDKTYRVNLKPGDYMTGGPMIGVIINPVTAEIIKIQNPNKYNIRETILAWQAPLHYGQAYGLWWKILVFLSGFLPLLFTITGITMWWKKKNGKKASERNLKAQYS